MVRSLLAEKGHGTHKIQMACEQNDALQAHLDGGSTIAHTTGFTAAEVGAGRTTVEKTLVVARPRNSRTEACHR